MKKIKILFCVLTSLLVLIISSCDTPSSSSNAALQYDDVLENGLGLSQSETVERYQIDESSVQKEDHDGEELWTLSEPEEVMGQPATVSLIFEDDSLTRASFVITIDNDPELVWKTLTDIYKDMNDKLGDPSSHIDGQEPFGRYTDYETFSEVVDPGLNTGIYTETNNWEQEDDINGPRASLSLTMFDSGSSTIEQSVYQP